MGRRDGAIWEDPGVISNTGVLKPGFTEHKGSEGWYFRGRLQRNL